MDAAEVFDRCRQRYESDQRYPTQASIEAMRALVDKLQMVVDDKAAPARPPRPDTGSSILTEAAEALSQRQSHPRDHFASG